MNEKRTTVGRNAQAGAARTTYAGTSPIRARVRARENAAAGFTMTELLTVVAILVILMAIAIPNLVGLVRDMRQKELDSKAETIYVAAQNEMSKLYASGCESYFMPDNDASKATVIKGVPSDATEEDGVEADSICYITSDDLATQGSAAQRIFENSDIDGELLGSSWVIEYGFSSGTIYAVFFSGDALFYSNPIEAASGYKGDFEKYDQLLRSRAQRLADGAKVGYHGGAGSASGSDSYKLYPSVVVTNEETLSASITCARPVGVSDNLVFRVKLTDAEGNSFERYYTVAGQGTVSGNTDNLEVVSGELTRTGRTFSLDLTLDSLASDDVRFVNQYGSGSGHNSDAHGSNQGEELASGTPLTVEVYVTCPGNQLVTQNARASAKTNSLFADDSSEAQAVVSYGRHLQNLDSKSGVSAKVVAAVQNSEIKLGADSQWRTAYGEGYFNGFASAGVPNFRPINNANLASYDGQGPATAPHSVSNLSVVSANDSVGLFESLSATSPDGTAARDVTIKNVVLSGASVSTSTNQSAGALVGWVGSFGSNGIAQSNAGTVSVENCQVLLTASDRSGKTNEDVWVSGGNAGGLVGALGDYATLRISDSFASTVVGTAGSASAGGRVGRIASESASASLATSYADCYLVGEDLGGLVGESLAGSVSVSNCYAAGFLTSSAEAAGLVDGAASIADSYTIAERFNATGDVYYSTAQSGTASNAYYAAGSSADTDLAGSTKIAADTTSADLASLLGSKFTANTTNTVAYNLMDQGLTTYTYPRLTAHDHYGDWVATFQEGTLVYYEKYADGSYGFFGANVESTLRSDSAVVGDGYGLVYERGSQPADLSQVKITVGDAETGISDYYEVEGSEATYFVYPLSVDVNNPDAAVEGFYEKVTIAGATTAAAEDAYYFNPHFAKTVRYQADASADAPELTSETPIYVRSARQLNNLSLYYDGYAEVTSPCTFLQERDIDYVGYGWRDFGNRADVTEQEPIGKGGSSESFVAVYDGQCNSIIDVSFVSGDGDNVGFVGYNEGTVKNVVIRTDYGVAESNYKVQRTGDVDANETVYMGVLAGYNAGTISNSAVAGYYLAGSDGTIHAYTNSHIYLGGLVGGNSGSISNSSADFPRMSLSATYATLRAGGFVGSLESGSVSNCYAVGHIEVLDARGGSVRIAGFAGANGGLISNSYCATALTASGAVTTTYGFCPKGGSAASCEYLDGGSYSYIGSLYLFKANAEDTDGSAASYAGLKGERVDGYADADHSLNHANTVTADNAFPYRAVVKNAAGEFVHYGDWQDDVNLGTFGVFYWEREESGSNNGYHFTYLGVNDSDTDKIASGSSLCNAHDDGGVITEYGYGFYVAGENEGQVDITSTGIAGGLFNDDGSYNANGSYNKEASSALASQMNSDSDHVFTFYAMTTRYDTSGDRLYLSSTTDVNGTWEVTFTPESGNAISETFTLSPFFANAISCADGGVVTDDNGDVHDASAAPGTSANTYEVRSADQLQYINWNSATKRVDEYLRKATGWFTVSTGEDSADKTCTNATSFPYLGYSYAEGSSAKQHHAAKYTWDQTHDVNADMSTDGSELFTPIGSIYDSNWGSANNTSYAYAAYFNGAYMGNSYKISNVQIDSKSQCVGLFGICIGATVDGVVLYSDQGNTIRTNEDGVGWYNLGAVAGMAFTGGNASSGFTNCTTAGYKLVDARSNHGYGGSNFGGFAGLTNVNLSGCAAVNDLTMAVNYSETSRNVRTGGLVGTFRGVTLQNCYAGGSITRLTTGTKGGSNTSTNFNCGGVVGGWFMRTAGNLSSLFGTLTAKPTVQNCYSYVNLSQITTSNSLCPIVSNGNNEGGSDNFTVSNCYYYEPSAASYKNRTVDDGGTKVIKVTYDQLSGAGKLTSGAYSGYTITAALNADKSKETPKPTAESPDRVGNTWEWVTTYDHAGGSIDGKYSFPGSNTALTGANYPFPTVITQKDLTFGNEVNVHYGEWPISGPYWEEGRATFDVFDQMGEGEDPWAYESFTLHPNGEDLGSLGADDFSFSTEGVVEFESATKEADGSYSVTFKALKTGTTVITLRKGDLSAAFTLEVTANLIATVWDEGETSELSELSVIEGETASVALRADSESGSNDFSTRVSWTMAPLDEKQAGLLDMKSPTADNKWTVERLGFGDVLVQVEAVYDYHGVECSDTAYLTVTQPNYVALANALSDTATYNRADVADSERTSVIGADYVYPASEATPRYSASRLFLFAPEGSDNLSSNMKVTQVAIEWNGSSYIINSAQGRDAVTGATFYADAAGSVEQAENKFECIPVQVSYIGYEAGAIENAKLTVTLENSVGATYTLSTTLPTVDKKAAVSLQLFANGGTGDARQYDLAEGATFTLPTAEAVGFARAGYKFEGWSDGENTYAAGDTITMGSSWKSLSAQWSLANYVVKADPAGGTLDFEGEARTDAVVLTAEATIYDGGVNLPVENPTRTGYTFKGWSADGGETVLQAGARVPGVASDTTYEAVWEAEDRTITFNLSGVGDVKATGYVTINGERVSASVPYTMTVKYDETVVLPTPYNEDVKFDGWKRGGRDVVKWTVTDDVEFDASWSEAFALTLVCGTDDDAQKVAYKKAALDGSSVYSDLIDVPDRSGWTLVGWYDLSAGADNGVKILNADGSVAAGAENVEGLTSDGAMKLDADKTLYARWRSDGETVYALTDALAEGEYVIADSNAAGSAIALKRDATAQYGLATSTDHAAQTVTVVDSAGSGYCDADGNAATAPYIVSDDSAFAFTATANGSSAFFLQANDGAYFYIAYNNGPKPAFATSKSAAEGFKWGYAGTYLSNGTWYAYPTSSGNGWNTSTRAGACYLYAKTTVYRFTYDASTTVTLDYNDADPEEGTESRVAEKTCFYAECVLDGGDVPTREGYEFAGWNTSADGSGTAYKTGDKINPSEVAKLYAQWTENARYNLKLAYDYDETELAYNDRPGKTLSSGDLAAYSNSYCEVGGWYTLVDVDYETKNGTKTGVGIGQKILNADGSVASGAENVEGYTANGKLALTEDRTLYASWTRFTGFGSIVGAWNPGTAHNTSGSRWSSYPLVLLEPGTYRLTISVGSGVDFRLGRMLYKVKDGEESIGNNMTNASGYQLDSGWRTPDLANSEQITIADDGYAFFGVNMRTEPSATLDATTQALFASALKNMTVERVS